MKLNRRMFALATIGLPLIDRGFATQGDASAEASPEATPTVWTPEEALELLLTTPFQSPLLPADTGEGSVVEWTDPGDEDFEGAIGGIVITTDPDNPDKALGVIALFPDAATATERIEPFIPSAESSMTEHRVEVGGAAGVSSIFEAPSGLSGDVNYVFSAVSSSFAVIAGAASSESIDGLELRSLANLVAVLDHFNRVVTE